MATDGMNRRTVLALLGGAGLALAGGPARASRPACYLSARVDQAGKPHATGFDLKGTVLFDIAMSARGHGGALNAGRNEVVLMARRPGTFAVVIDVASGAVAARFEAPENNWFNGHAVCADNGLLYATETAMDSGAGRIGVYDPRQGYRRIGEMAAHGLEPHDIGLLADGHTLVVANGGVLRHPDAPETILNLADMRPNLAYVDGRNGILLDRVEPPPILHRLGTRHLAVAPDDTVVVAMQYEGPATDKVPLFGLHRFGEADLRLLEPPPRVLGAMRQYCGAAAVAAGGRVVGVSCPRGNMAVFWDVAGGGFMGAVTVPDGCGIAPGPGAEDFLIASGLGGVVAWSPSMPQGAAVSGGLIADSQWDNHLIRLG